MIVKSQKQLKTWKQEWLRKLWYCHLIFLQPSKIAVQAFFFNVYLFTVVFGLHCCADFSLVVASGGYSTAVVRGLRVTVAPVAEHAPWLLWLQQLPRGGLSSRSAWALEPGSIAAPQHVGSYWIRNHTRVSSLAGGFFTTEPPGKPCFLFLFFFNRIFQFLLYLFNENVKIIHYLLIPQSKCKGFSFVSRLGYDVYLV